MKTKLLFAKLNSNTFYCLLVFCLCFNYGWSQNIALNSTMDEFQATTNDNSDAWDMSPPSSVVTDADAANVPTTTTTSPYKRSSSNPNGWNNSDLDTWLNNTCLDDNEAPGSSSDGNFDYSAGPDMGVKTRGVKINEACRRLYQYLPVTAGTSYTLFIESRSEAAGHPTELYILNTEIVDEVGLSSTATTVDAFKLITNDFNASKSNETTDNFTKSSLEFTPSGAFIVIYVKSPNTTNNLDEVFYDNIELYETSSLSVEEKLASSFNIYPNPAQDFIQIESKDVSVSSIEMYSLVGQKVISEKNLVNSKLNISSLNSGVYLLKVNTDNGSLTKKIIVK